MLFQYEILKKLVKYIDGSSSLPVSTDKSKVTVDVMFYLNVFRGIKLTFTSFNNYSLTKGWLLYEHVK